MNFARDLLKGEGRRYGGYLQGEGSYLQERDGRGDNLQGEENYPSGPYFRGKVILHYRDADGGVPDSLCFSFCLIIFFSSYFMYK